MMDRKSLEKYILDNYSVQADHPWTSNPNFEVFRHTDNQKWFALIMDVSKDKLGLPETDILDIVNFKAEPVLISMLRSEAGFFSAYHMNKENWITVALDGSVPDEKIKMLADMSYKMTESKRKK